jgi:hypothetical protein
MSEFEKLYKETLRTLEEALGIPTNIVEEAERVYDKFLELLESVDGSEIVYEKFTNNFQLKLGKETYKDLTTKVYFEQVPNFSKPVLKKFVAPLLTALSIEKLKLRNLTDYENLTIELFVCVSSAEQQMEAKEVLEIQKEKMLSVIAHELHHSYSFSKQKSIVPKRMIDYKIVSQIEIPVGVIQQFFDNLYFVSAFEGLVGPSEIASKIAQRRIKKKDFVKFLDQDEVYKRLRRIENTEPVKFVETLKESVQEIEEFLKKERVVEDLQRDEKINKALAIIFERVVVKYREHLEDYVKSALQSILMNFKTEEEIKKDLESLREYCLEMNGDFKKFQGRELQYFLKKISEMKEIAGVLRKRLAKLYDLCFEEGIREEI